MGSTAFGITLGASRAPARSWKSPDTRGVRFRSAHPVAYPPPFIAESTSIRRSRHGLSPRIVGAHTGVLLRCEEILLHEACRGFLAQWDVDGATDWLTGTPVTARMPSWASHLISSPLRSVGGFPLLCGNEGVCSSEKRSRPPMCSSRTRRSPSTPHNRASPRRGTPVILVHHPPYHGLALTPLHVNVVGGLHGD